MSTKPPIADRTPSASCRKRFTRGELRGGRGRAGELGAQDPGVVRSGGGKRVEALRLLVGGPRQPGDVAARARVPPRLRSAAACVRASAASSSACTRW